MQVGEPSRTARAAAFHRAALQVLEHGRIFADPLALRILGEYADAVAREAERRPSGRGMRIFIAVRTRFAEDALAAAVERGVPQLVVLGAGLETTGSLARFRGRSSSPAGLEAPAPRRGWHPAAGGADVRSIGFERETLAEGLAAAGFDPSAWTFFTWLGVVPYLTEEAVWATAGFVASLPNGAHAVFDYGDAPASLSPEMRASHERRAAQVTALGEPFMSYFEPLELRAKLISLGFSEVEDLGPRQIASRYFPSHADTAPERGGHILRATTIAGPAKGCGPLPAARLSEDYS